MRLCRIFNLLHFDLVCTLLFCKSIAEELHFFFFLLVSAVYVGGSSSGGSRLKFEPHAGPVLGVAASPFHRLLFVSAGADGALRLSSLLQPKPLCDFDTTCAAPGKGQRKISQKDIR